MSGQVCLRVFDLTDQPVQLSHISPAPSAEPIARSEFFPGFVGIPGQTFLLVPAYAPPQQPPPPHPQSQYEPEAGHPHSPQHQSYAPNTAYLQYAYAHQPRNGFIYHFARDSSPLNRAFSSYSSARSPAGYGSPSTKGWASPAPRLLYAPDVRRHTHGRSSATHDDAEEGT